MKKLLVVEGKLRTSYYDEEYYNTVGENNTTGVRIRIDRWSAETYSHSDLVELKKFVGKKVKIVVTLVE